MKADPADAHFPGRLRAPALDQEPPSAQKPLAYRASFLVAIPGTPDSSVPNCRKSLNHHFRSVPQTRGCGGGFAATEAVGGGCGFGCVPGFSSVFSGLGGAGSDFLQGSRLGSNFFPLFQRAEARLRRWGTVSNPASARTVKPLVSVRFSPPRRREDSERSRFSGRAGRAPCTEFRRGSEEGCRLSKPRLLTRPEAAFPQLSRVSLVFLHSRMDPERERSGGHPKKGRKRRRAPNMLLGAAEAMRARRDLEERQPEAKDTQRKHTGRGRTPCGFRAEIRLLHFKLCSLPCHRGFSNSGLPGIGLRRVGPTGSISPSIMRRLKHRKRMDISKKYNTTSSPRH